MKNFIRKISPIIFLCVLGTCAAQSFDQFMDQKIAEVQASGEPDHFLKTAILNGITVLQGTIDGGFLGFSFLRDVRDERNAPFLKTAEADERDLGVLGDRLVRLQEFAQGHGIPLTRAEYDAELALYELVE